MTVGTNVPVLTQYDTTYTAIQKFFHTYAFNRYVFIKFYILVPVIFLKECHGFCFITNL